MPQSLPAFVAGRLDAAHRASSLVVSFRLTFAIEKLLELVRRTGQAFAVLLCATAASAGPITNGAFTTGGMQAWVVPFVPGDALSLTSPFGFANGSFEWSYLYEETNCGQNQIGWEGLETPSVGVIFDFGAQPGAMTSLLLPMATNVTSEVADNVWTSSDAGSPFTLFADSTDNYYVAMETVCADEALGSSGTPSESSGSGGDGSGAPGTPAPARVTYNRALIRITIRPLPLISTTPPPETTSLSDTTSPASVPEPATLSLVALGLAAATSVRAIRAASSRHKSPLP